jgi:hypothetical protein
MRKWLSESLLASREPKSQIGLISRVLSDGDNAAVFDASSAGDKPKERKTSLLFYIERRIAALIQLPDEAQSEKSAGLAAYL